MFLLLSPLAYSDHERLWTGVLSTMGEAVGICPRVRVGVSQKINLLSYIHLDGRPTLMLDLELTAYLTASISQYFNVFSYCKLSIDACCMQGVVSTARRPRRLARIMHVVQLDPSHR